MPPRLADVPASHAPNALFAGDGWRLPTPLVLEEPLEALVVASDSPRELDRLLAWLDRVFPGWEDLLRVAVDAAQWLLGWAGSAAPVLAWIVFALCASFVLAGAGLLTLSVKLLRKASARQASA